MKWIVLVLVHMKWWWSILDLVHMKWSVLVLDLVHMKWSVLVLVRIRLIVLDLVRILLNIDWWFWWFVLE